MEKTTDRTNLSKISDSQVFPLIMVGHHFTKFLRLLRGKIKYRENLLLDGKKFGKRFQISHLPIGGIKAIAKPRFFDQKMKNKYPMETFTSDLLLVNLPIVLSFTLTSFTLL